ncbi:cytochrome P450 [Mycena rosella]|uniref:Cytochrome P450 n=1 Tax=Mycena rosella TaxID=1033263 RepID=A0AAD7DC79_MYCRO|nr:cytochrome P450 [Mycena rosella]
MNLITSATLSSMENLEPKTLLIYGLAAAVTISWLCSGEKSTIPAIIGSKGVISSYTAALHYLRHATDVIQQGYQKYPDGVFRVPTLVRWDYVANGAQRLAELSSAPDHILSFNEGASDGLQSDYTMGPEITMNPYHAAAIRGSLTRNLARCFPQVRDEIVHAFDDVLLLNDNEWKEIQVLASIMQVVARTSNRLFVGLPLCRQQEFLDLNVNYTASIFIRGQIISLIPVIFRPIFGPLISTRKSTVRHALKFLGPMIDERLEKEGEYGREWPGRPNDLISWLLDIAEGEERKTPALAMRILVTNMAAIHTSSMTLTAALYDLTTYPEHILPMRKEAERVIAEEGWSKASLANMHKIDSFLRESQRLTAADAISMSRKVVAKDGFTFSDGVTIPRGSFVSVPGTAIHYDPDNYEHAAVFDGFRFSRLREQRGGPASSGDEGSEGTGFFNRHMVSTAQDHVVFGHGRHACPGRFFAATELKAMLAHMLINYDVKAMTEGVRPPDDCFGVMRMPNSRGKIMIRRRV